MAKIYDNIDRLQLLEDGVRHQCPLPLLILGLQAYLAPRSLKKAGLLHIGLVVWTGIAAGCSQAVKPSEETPLTALAFARIFERVSREVGAPPAAFSCIVGDAATIARAFIEHPATRKLTFTGSTEVGRLLAAQCAPRLMRTARSKRRRSAYRRSRLAR